MTCGNMGTRQSSAKFLRKPYANYMICMAGALKSVPFVRHEVARVFVKESKIRCSATGTLPGRASGVTSGCEASGTPWPPPDKRATDPRGDVVTASLMAVGS